MKRGNIKEICNYVFLNPLVPEPSLNAEAAARPQKRQPFTCIIFSSAGNKVRADTK